LCTQETALLHALQFPALQRLVYSTCSIHQRENEDVVAAVLPAATAAGFRLVDPFPSWHRRGLPVVEGAELLVRTDAHADGTDGFFVAVFERSGEGAAQAEQHQEVAVLPEQQQELRPEKKKKRAVQQKG
jgi:putative methyltransferase